MQIGAARDQAAPQAGDHAPGGVAAAHAFEQSFYITAKADGTPRAEVFVYRASRAEVRRLRYRLALGPPVPPRR